MSNDLLHIAGSLFLSGGLCAYYGKAGYAASGFVVGFFCALVWWGLACNYKKKVLQEEAEQREKARQSTGPGIESNGEALEPVYRKNAAGEEIEIRATVGTVKPDFQLEINKS